ncbi:uncharacterized protein ARMOST_15644 [Armillaria ostoyae]|uniref:Uncharacterized protein n=1 Tax=Armillaria ostoyae TaxID=47428 RepID=A0A284RU35_ARMOS|nr:uncharacterized protein ARMOST_15644 [Armillaria ostoyae]
MDLQAPDQTVRTTWISIKVQEENGVLGRFSSFRKNRYNQYHMSSSSDQRLPANECLKPTISPNFPSKPFASGDRLASEWLSVPYPVCASTTGIFLQSVTSSRTVVAWLWLGVDSMELKEDGTECVSTISWWPRKVSNIVIFSDAAANLTLPPKLLAYGDVVLLLTVRISYNAFIRGDEKRDQKATLGELRVVYKATISHPASILHALSKDAKCLVPSCVRRTHVS